jgi:SagB-type dehydrogenase family enzyme
MNSPIPVARRTAVRNLDDFISPLGFTAPEMEEIEVFHEATKLKPFHEKTLGQRIGTYLTAERAVIETASNYKDYVEARVTVLPPPAPITATVSDAFLARASCRSFAGEPITLGELSQILSAVRATRKATLSQENGLNLWFRPYPSGGGLYPSEIYVLACNVDGIAPGIMHYNPREHAVARIGDMPPLSQLRAALGDEEGHAFNVGAIFLITTIPERSVVKYAFRGYRFALMEAGMIPMMLNMAATGVGLGSLHWGGFLDDRANALIDADGISENVAACLLVGRLGA